MQVSILVDAGYFLKRVPKIFPKVDHKNPEETARLLQAIAYLHLRKARKQHPKSEVLLYRIFVYDCPPLEKKFQHPLTNRTIDYAKTPQAKFRNEFHEALRCTRKVALRLGSVHNYREWKLHQDKMKALLQGKITVADLDENDVVPVLKQKAVDMKIGVDIASLAFKKQVQQIILIAGDSDFVPASKLARREGIDFILDPLNRAVKQDLHEHIDGLWSFNTLPPDQAQRVRSAHEIQKDVSAAQEAKTKSRKRTKRQTN